MDHAAQLFCTWIVYSYMAVQIGLQFPRQRDQYLDRKLSSERFSYSSCAGRSCNLAEEYGSISDP